MPNMQDFNNDEQNVVDEINDNSNFTNKIVEFIKFLLTCFHKTSPEPMDRCSINNIVLDFDLLTDRLIEEVANEVIANATDAIIHVHLHGNWYGFANIQTSVPITNFRMTTNIDTLLLVFESTNIVFPEECLPIGASQLLLYDYRVSNPSKLPCGTKSTAFVNCDFINSLKGWQCKSIDIDMEACTGFKTFNGISFYNDMHSISIGHLANSTCELQNFKGLPKIVSMFILKTIDRIENLNAGPNTHRYAACSGEFAHSKEHRTFRYANLDFIKSVSQCQTSFDSVCFVLPPHYRGPLMQFYFLDCDDLFFEVNFGDDRLFIACQVVARGSVKEDKSTRGLLDCQEQLYDLGLSEYAKIK